MTLTKRLASPVSLIASLIAAVFCTAAAANDDAVPANTLRVGMYFVKFSAAAGDLSGPFTPPGLNLRVAEVNTLYVAYLRRLTSHWTLELAAGNPPTTHTFGVGPARVGSVPFNGEEVATAKWFSPTVLLDYMFLDEHSRFRPYAGVGVNYTHFFHRNATAAGIAITGGPTTTYLSDSAGPAATLGVSYNFTKHCNAIASYNVAQISSEFDANTSGINRTTHVNFNPRLAVVAVGYSF